MKATRFIADRLHCGDALVVCGVALSFLVMILAISVSGGFRREIRSAVSGISGDIQLTPLSMDYMGEEDPISASPSFAEDILSQKGVESMAPVIYRTGIVRSGDTVHGVVFKGTEADTASLGVRIPRRLSQILQKGVGDDLPAYFVSDRVKVRKFRVTGIYDSVLETPAAMVIYAPIKDMRRLNGWDESLAGALEISLDDSHKSNSRVDEAGALVGTIVVTGARDSSEELVATTARKRWPQLFGWLDLLDFNVLIIIVLMTLVAGFNMISGLLIMLFRNISTIGILKAMGMDDRGVAGVFLRVSSQLVLKGMAIGNALALLFCLLQSTTHLVKLNPANYFVSFVPVSVNLSVILLADLGAFVVIMLLLLIPCRFISHVDPARTVKAD